MVKQLSAHEYPLRKVFCSDYEFSIPDYQRPYRWGTSEALQLLDDLEEALERGDAEPYFLGSLVLVEDTETQFEVIDGQQRLTTLSLLFAVLRDLAEDDDVRKELASLVMEPGVKLDGIKAKPRLTLRKQDAKFFQRYVQEPGSIASLVDLRNDQAVTEPQRAIRDNAGALWDRLSECDEQHRNDLATLMRTATYLVVVKTPDLNSAYRIFSVMNARGLDLAPTDIFKSRVIGALPEDSDYAKQWEAAEESLGSDAFTDLFRDLRTVVNGDRARLELLREFPEQVLNDYLENGKAAEFVDCLLMPYATAFEQTVRSGAGEGNGSVNRWLRRLSMIDNKDWRPIALWALVTHGQKPEFVTELLRRLERLAASFLLRQEYTTPRIARYLEVLRELKAGRGLDSPSLTLTPAEVLDTRAALEGDVYLMQSKRARYVLLRLDELLAREPGATYRHEIISIEHVLPQNPGAESNWLADFTEEDRQNWTHKLGNLVLLNRRKNSYAQNYDFDVKKSRYFAGENGSAVFALTTQVLSEQQWTPEVLEERQTRLVGLLSREWELN